MSGDYFDSGYGDTIALLCGECDRPITDIDRGDPLSSVLAARDAHECDANQDDED